METRVVAEPRRVRFLPPLIRRQRWALAYLIIWIPYIGIYQVVNRFPLREPIELSFSWIDAQIPFLPELLPVYVAYLPFYLWTVARSENDREANRIFYGTHLQLLISLCFFVALPVRMPRELFYGAEVYGWADSFWRWFDAPNNCFPSLHTSSCLLLMQFNWCRRHRWPSTFAGAAVIASTVLVKQHYAIDLAGGVVIYALSRWFLARTEVARINRDGWIEHARE